MDVLMTPVPFATTNHHNDVVPFVSEADADLESDDGSNMDMDNEDGAFLSQVYDIKKDEDLPDDGYDATFMEEDGTYNVDHVWSYIDLTTELEQPNNMYNGVGPCLKRGVAEVLISICSKKSQLSKNVTFTYACWVRQGDIFHQSSWSRCCDRGS